MLLSGVFANEEYRAMLSEARAGISLSEAEVKHLDFTLSPFIKKGQSLIHILVNNRNSIMGSQSTVYQLIDYKVFTARNIDLPRKVRYSKRRARIHAKVDKKYRMGRTYEDILLFMKEYPHLPVTQIDSVEEKKAARYCLPSTL